MRNIANLGILIFSLGACTAVPGDEPALELERGELGLSGRFVDDAGHAVRFETVRAAADGPIVGARFYADGTGMLGYSVASDALPAGWQDAVDRAEVAAPADHMRDLALVPAASAALAAAADERDPDVAALTAVAAFGGLSDLIDVGERRGDEGGLGDRPSQLASLAAGCSVSANSPHIRPSEPVTAFGAASCSTGKSRTFLVRLGLWNGTSYATKAQNGYSATAYAYGTTTSFFTSCRKGAWRNYTRITDNATLGYSAHWAYTSYPSC